MHILAESAENNPVNLQSEVHDWVDLRGKPDEDQAETVTQADQPDTQADKVQHEVAALKMAQGLLKGMLASTSASSACCWRQAAVTYAASLQISTYHSKQFRVIVCINAV